MSKLKLEKLKTCEVFCLCYICQKEDCKKDKCQTCKRKDDYINSCFSFEKIAN